MIAENKISDDENHSHEQNVSFRACELILIIIISHHHHHHPFVFTLSFIFYRLPFVKPFFLPVVFSIQVSRTFFLPCLKLHFSWSLSPYLYHLFSSLSTIFNLFSLPWLSSWNNHNHKATSLWILLIVCVCVHLWVRIT